MRTNAIVRQSLIRLFVQVSGSKFQAFLIAPLAANRSPIIPRHACYRDNRSGRVALLSFQ